MSRVIVPTLRVGNEFLLAKPEKQKMKVEITTPEASLPPQPLAVAVEMAQPAIASSAINDDGTSTPPAPLNDKGRGHLPTLTRPSTDDIKRILKKHPVAITAGILLIIGSAGIIVGGRYWADTHIVNHTASTGVKVGARPISGLNLTVPAAQYQARLATITNQPTTLTVGPYTTSVNSNTIRNWLKITTNKSKSEYYIHLDKAAIATSLTQLANKYVKSPVNQVTVNEDGADHVVVGGRNGTALVDPNSLNIQAQQVAKTVMDGKGMQFNTPLQTVPFQSVTPAAYSKLLVADINTKKMWAFQNGQQVNSWLISAGKPSTPTPVGQFKVYAKFTVQDMRGTNPDGTPYFQPHVRWISYFYQGSAVHGVYWHPRTWFGVNNSSHGCIGLPEDEAKWVYDWAPIGTTVIAHT